MSREYMISDERKAELDADPDVAPMSDDLIERLRTWAKEWPHWKFTEHQHVALVAVLDALAAKDTALSEWKAMHGRVVEGFMEVCEAVGVQFDAPEAVAYAINVKISNAEHDRRAAEAALSEMRRAIIGGEPDPTVTHGQFLEMIRLAEDARLGAIARATAAEAELERARIIIENCIVQITTLHGVDHVVLTARAFLAARALAPSIQDETDLGARE